MATTSGQRIADQIIKKHYCMAQSSFMDDTSRNGEAHYGWDYFLQKLWLKKYGGVY